MRFTKHRMVQTLLHLKGNPKACVYTEPLWGIPYNLYAPYVSLYMYAFGISDKQIGFLASIGMAFQIVFAMLSGVVTDKLGRRKTTYLFDFLSWSIPCILWAVAQNFTYFLIAALFNSTYRLTTNSWNCLLVEDCEKEKLVDVYGWVYISGLLAAFFAPLASIFVKKYELIPTVRVLYLIAFVLMTAKFIILYVYSTETKQGSVRIQETKGQSMFTLLAQYRTVLPQVFKAKGTLIALGIMIIMSICTMVNNTFWYLFVTENLQIPVETVSLFPFIKSALMLVFYFTIVPRLSVFRFKKPMALGFLIFIISQVVLISSSQGGYIVLIISTLLEAASLSLINPLMDSLIVASVDPKERARIMAVVYVIIIALTSPFGYIAGYLSAINRILPFIMNMALFVLGLLLTRYASTTDK